MFSIAAINDEKGSRNHWQPLAPTKEAQEFHLSQLYHDGLLKLQAKDYVKARELLETVLKDPLVENAQGEGGTSGGQLSQLRYLALKNLATVSLQQGPSYHETAMHCYLQAVEIDDKDSVVWNQLGTLACSMGSLSISRWAFEQGLVCSPRNWNCMEKLLEVLIAIGDEVACLSVAELVLRHWPSHSRALHVKNTIEDPVHIPFKPRGIDKLEPKHARLKFPAKRKAADEELDDESPSKKLKESIEIQLSQASWMALAGELMKILGPASSNSGSPRAERYRHRDVKLIIHLPSPSAKYVDTVEAEGRTCIPAGSSMSSAKLNSVSDKEESASKEQLQERRSIRLRTRKPGKEESDCSSNKDHAKAVNRFLKPYMVIGTDTTNCKDNFNPSLRCAEVVAYSLDSESTDVTAFVQNNFHNFGAHHMGHLLLEEIANKSILYHDNLTMILDLEKVTRDWPQDRTRECSLFLSELYCDIGLRSSGVSTMRSFMSESNYHVCKIIESAALKYPFGNTGIDEKGNFIMTNVVTGDDHPLPMENPFWLGHSPCFWIRFHWLNACLSHLEGDKERAQKQFSVAFALFKYKDRVSKSSDSIYLPHCKAIGKLTIKRIEHEINLIEVDYLFKNFVSEMLEKKKYAECANMLAPLLFTDTDVHLDILYAWDYEGKGFNTVELSALDILIKSCELAETMDTDVYLSCHRRKLQILIAAAGLESSSPDNGGLHVFSSCESKSKEALLKNWNNLVAEEVKAISQSASKLRSISSSKNVPMAIIGDIQELLLIIMCSIANSYTGGKSSRSSVPESAEQTEDCYLVDAAIAFFKLQQLDLNVTIKSQTELIVAIHDMLAEFGICCARGDGEEEGTFLKLAIKHLLSLDMKLKSSMRSLNKEKEIKDTLVKDTVDEVCPGIVSSGPDVPEEVKMFDSYRLEDMCNTDDIGNNPSLDCKTMLTEDDMEELELSIDSALDQCFYCLYGLNLRSDSSSEEDLITHKNTCQGDYQTKEQCADVFQYILPYAKDSSKTGLVKLRKVLRAIRKHFPQPPEDVLAGNAINKFLDDPALCEDKLSEEVGSDGFISTIIKVIFPDSEIPRQKNTSSAESSDAYLEVYQNLYYLIAQSEEISATDKWAGFVLTKEGEEFVEHNANLFKYDLLYNPLRFESWQGLANIYDEEVDLLLNDGSKQINVLGWRKNDTLPQRVEASRRRSRRCLLMTSALAKTASQQGEIHELLALVYYDGLQNVVPFYDQRSLIPSRDAVWRMFCQHSMNHFDKAFKLKEDWSHKYYMGKLCEKLGYSHDISLAHYAEAIALNPSAVDPFYRMHASRLKLLCKLGKQHEDALKVIATHSFCQSTRENVMDIFHGLEPGSSDVSMHVEDGTPNDHSVLVHNQKLDEVWNLLYSDCLSALVMCVEGDLKHFHKARYMLAQGLYRRGGTGDIEKSKEELSFCFKSSRSSFTINMWEIDSTVKKGRRKTPGPSGNRRVLDVNLAESSRKFITCIRKYILFYLKLLEQTGDILTLDRAYITLRADKRFSLCLEDLVPLTLGRYIRALIMSISESDGGSSGASDSVEQPLEKLFNLFLDQVNLWSDICNLPELKSPELTESSLYGYLYQYVHLLERNVKVEALEGINEKIRKRLKNPKLSNSNCAKVYRHVSAAWCRSLVISMALITPLHSRHSTEICGGGQESDQLLCVDLQSEELWSSAFEDPNHLKTLETKWNPSLSKIKNVLIKRVSDEDLETAATVLRSSYNFYKDMSCALLPSGINLYMAPAQLATETYIQPGIDGVDILDMNTSRKLLLWAYSLLNGHCTNISYVIKYCEENAKSRMKKGTAGTSTPSSANVQTTTSQAGGGKDVVGKNREQETHIMNPVPPQAPYPEPDSSSTPARSTSPATEHETTPKESCALLDNSYPKNVIVDSLPETDRTCNMDSDPKPCPETTCSVPSETVPASRDSSGMNRPASAEEQQTLLAAPYLVQCSKPAETSIPDLQNDADETLNS